jgi:hypothetical protein
MLLVYEVEDYKGEEGGRAEEKGVMINVFR